MPITDRSQAKESGFAQVREALMKFKGRVTSAEFDTWGGQLVDDAGRKKPPREFLEITCEDVEALEVTEELVMDISELWTFRVNCSDFKGSFWIEKFLESADRFKVLVPEGLINKVVTWEKVTLEAFDKDGNAKPEFDSTNNVIAGIEESKVKVTPKAKTQAAPKGAEAEAPDYMRVIAELAIGKTVDELKAAIPERPELRGSPVLPLAVAGTLTTALVNDGTIVLVDGKYQKPG